MRSLNASRLRYITCIRGITVLLCLIRCCVMKLHSFLSNRNDRILPFSQTRELRNCARGRRIELGKHSGDLTRSRAINGGNSMAVDATPISSTVHNELDSAPGSHRSQPWYLAYRDALFESDRNRVRERIRRAERLIITRERELFSLENSFGEQRALDNALHALRALRTCLGV